VVVREPLPSLNYLKSRGVAVALKWFLERTWSSHLLSETIKIRRFVICIRAIDAAHISHTADELFSEFARAPRGFLQSVELGHSLISWDNNYDPKTSLVAQGVIACIIANVQQRNERWNSLTMNHLGVSEHVL